VVPPSFADQTHEGGVAGEANHVTGVAGRYASALFDLAKESGTVEAVESDFGRFEALLNDSPDLDRLVRSPAFTSEQQLAAVDAVLRRAGIGGLAGNFIKLAASNRRLFAIRGMIAAFRALSAAARGETTAQVTVAEPLTPRQESALKAALHEVTGKDVRIEAKVDPAILGGLIVQIGSRMVDSSLKTRLNGIKHAMKEVG
jgi:F-type H+-transporting ATPase subunit delta